MAQKINRKVSQPGVTGKITGESGAGTRKMTPQELSEAKDLIENIGTHKENGFVFIIKAVEGKDGKTTITGTVLNNGVEKHMVIKSFFNSVNLNPLELLSHLM